MSAPKTKKSKKAEEQGEKPPALSILILSPENRTKLDAITYIKLKSDVSEVYRQQEEDISTRLSLLDTE